MAVYVIQTEGGKEKSVLSLIEQRVDRETCTGCFVPRVELSKSFRGVRRRVESVLFPGYVFALSGEPARLDEAVRKLPSYARVLSAGEKWVPLNAGEIAWLRAFLSPTGEESHPRGQKWHGGGSSKSALCALDDEIEASLLGGSQVVAMSEGYIEGDEIVVLSGPLMGRTAQIKKIDRHKRLAYLDVCMCGRTKMVKLGLEIVRKKAKTE